MPPSRPLHRDALIAVSLANLLALRLWAAVLDPATTYFLDRPRPWQGYVATLLVFTVLAACGLLVVLVARRTSGRGLRALEIAFFGMLALSIYGAREQLGDLAGMPVRTYVRDEGAIGFAMTVLAAGVFACAFAPPRFRVPFRRGAFLFLLVFSPFCAVTVAQTAVAGWRAADGTTATRIAPRPPAARMPRAPGVTPPTRVLVLILDEWDQFTTFEDRTPGVSFPALDGLVAESTHFTRAVSPGNVTELVLPSLLTSRRVVRTGDAGPSDRRLWFEDGDSALFSDSLTFFSLLRESGRNAGITGWYHPYCRVLGDDVAACSSRGIRPEFDGLSLRDATARQARILFESLPQTKKLGKLLGLEPTRLTPRDWHDESWRRIHADVLAMARDPELDVVVGHYPIPHGPWVGETKGVDGNMAIVSRCIAELREALEEEALSGRTAIVVLADHPKRTKGLLPKSSPRLAPGEARPVPFIVKMPEGGGGGADDRAFSTMTLHDLVLELVEGTMRTSEDLEAWLVQRDAFTLAP